MHLRQDDLHGTEQPDTQAAAAPKKRGRPRKAETASADAGAGDAAPKKRGRPRKASP